MPNNIAVVMIAVFSPARDFIFPSKKPLKNISSATGWKAIRKSIDGREKYSSNSGILLVLLRSKPRDISKAPIATITTNEAIAVIIPHRNAISIPWILSFNWLNISFVENLLTIKYHRKGTIMNNPITINIWNSKRIISNIIPKDHWVPLIWFVWVEKDISK